MKFDNQKVDTSGVDDRRGARGGRGLAVGGGAGVVGLLVVLLVSFLGGGGATNALDPAFLDSVLGAGGAASSTSDLATRCAEPGAIDSYDDCYIVKVYNETDEIWNDEIAALAETYRSPQLVLYSGQVSTACGSASAQVGPFYCPGDEAIYLDLEFMAALQQQFGAEGRYAQAYIVAHEFGHHIQTVLGIEPQVRRAQRQDPSSANQLSVAMELQADCFAGVWGRLANDRGNLSVTQTEVQQAQDAAAAVGDDRIQRQTQGRVDPEGWTHGSAQQRRTWYDRGFDGGQVSVCDTFAPGAL